MANDTVTLMNLIIPLMKETGNYFSTNTTTNIAANNLVKSTNLNAYDEGRDGFFDNYWLYLNTTNNESVVRKVGRPATTTYAYSTGQLTVTGSALTAETAAQTIYLSAHSYTQMKNSVLEAVKLIYPTWHLDVDNQALSTGNLLVDGHLDEWASSSSLTYWTGSNTTLARTSTVAYKRGGTYSCKITAGAANAYIYENSDTYPRLLLAQGKTIDAYVWAYPEVANDASIIIYTVSRDGSTTETETSSTSNPAGYWTLLHLQANLNDDLQSVEARLNVETNGKYVYFDNFWFGCPLINEYYLPSDFDDGHVSQAYIQTTGHETPIMYDINPFVYDRGREFKPEVFGDGTYKYLRTPEFLNKRMTRLLGYKPLETLSSDTDTLTVPKKEWIPLLIKLAKRIFWQREYRPYSKETRERAIYEAMNADREYRELSNHMRMPRPVEIL